MTVTPYPGTFTSTAQSVKQTLVTALQALTDSGDNLDGVQVTYGWPGREPERNWLFLGDITWSGEDWAPQGSRKREERYEIDLVVSVSLPGGSDEELETTAFSFLGAVESYLRNNPFQPATGQIAALDLVPVSARTAPLPDAVSECEIRAKVRVMARI